MKKIMIDVGHGGADPGACANGLKEKELNLKVATKVRELLSSYEVDVRLTRDTDISLKPDERVRIVNDFNPDLCISIHHNSSNGQARGAEVIHAAAKKADDSLAADILHLLSCFGMPTRRSYSKLNDSGKDYYYMIRSISDNDTDAVITEAGFVDNPEDAKLLKDDKFLDKEAFAIATAAVDYLGLEYREKVVQQQEHWGVPLLQKLKELKLISSDHDPETQVTWAEFASVICKLIKS